MTDLKALEAEAEEVLRRASGFHYKLSQNRPNTEPDWLAHLSLVMALLETRAEFAVPAVPFAPAAQPVDEAIENALKYDERIWRAYLLLKTCHKEGLRGAIRKAIPTAQKTRNMQLENAIECMLHDLVHPALVVSLTATVQSAIDRADLMLTGRNAATAEGREP